MLSEIILPTVANLIDAIRSYITEVKIAYSKILAS